MNGPDNLLPSPIEAAPVPEVRNHTRYPSQYFQMIDVADDIFHVMVTRITYDLSDIDDDGYPMETEDQGALCEADEHYGEPNASSVVQESDYAPFKPKCDVLFANTSAWAPLAANGKRRALARFPAGVRIDFTDGTHWQKLLTVAGPRTLGKSRIGGLSLGEPEPATSVAIRYEKAFGGSCQWWKGWPQPADADQRMEIDVHEAHNPIGCGYVDPAWQKKTRSSDFPAPQIEVFEQPFTIAHAEKASAESGATNAQAAYPVVGLGAIGRWWQPRRSKAGSFDEVWKATRWPRLPGDFDFAYWNAAPEDQQFDYFQGEEQFTLVNLHETHGELRFRLPKPVIKLLLHLEAGVPVFKPLSIDTIVIDMEALTLSVVQRALIGAASGTAVIELGVWNIEAARAKNAAVLDERAAAYEDG